MSKYCGGYQAHDVANGGTALTIPASDVPVDILLTMLVMVVMNGMQFAAAVGDIRPEATTP